jgi:hypothetical protein
LCEVSSIPKIELFESTDKKVFIGNIEKLLNTSIDVIPKHLPGIDGAALGYTESLKTVAKNYVQELRKLSIREIKEKIKQIQITSKEIRVKMFYDLKSEHLALMADDDEYEKIRGLEGVKSPKSLKEEENSPKYFKETGPGSPEETKDLQSFQSNKIISESVDNETQEELVVKGFNKITEETHQITEEIKESPITVENNEALSHKTNEIIEKSEIKKVDDIHISFLDDNGEPCMHRKEDIIEIKLSNKMPKEGDNGRSKQ